MNEEIYPITQKSENKELIRFSLSGTTFPDKNYRIHRKNAPTACIEYIEEGTGTVEIDGKSFRPCAGDSYFLQLGYEHLYYADTEQPWKKHFINVSGKLLRSLTEGYGLDGHFHFKNLDIKDELLRIITLAKDSEHDSTAQMIVILNEIFCKMHSHVRMESPMHASAVENNMKDFLNTKVTEKFRITELCQHVGRSESQTIRIFKKAYGITPYTYLLNRKIALAQRLLTNTALTVREISEKLCFSDEYYFSDLFKKKTGFSPIAYRKEAESKQNE